MHHAAAEDFDPTGVFAERAALSGAALALDVEFKHVDDRTEDHIQSALLSEIERSVTDGRIADIV